MVERASTHLARLVLPLHAQPELEKTVDALLACLLLAVDRSRAGVWICRDGVPTPAAASDPGVARADRTQVEVLQGPSLAAIETGEVVLVADTATDSRWPAWCRTAGATGLATVVSLPMQLDGTPLGALTLARSTPYGFERSDVATAQTIAHHASTAISVRRRAAGLWRELDEREVIGQAQGVLMERYRLDPEQSLDGLRNLGRQHGITLFAAAETLLAGSFEPAAVEQGVGKIGGPDGPTAF